jgi:choline dehydrogenase-like flavoprotein
LPETIYFQHFSYDPRPQAIGVKFWHDGHEKVAKTHGEVILSAGAIASPQILMLSGIGPANHLVSMLQNFFSFVADDKA